MFNATSDCIRSNVLASHYVFMFLLYSIVFSHTSMMLVFVLSGGQPGSALANVVQIYGQGEYIL